eukprot:scaffold2796_cov31-Tisochrysis_lutea.AAC.3
MRVDLPDPEGEHHIADLNGALDVIQLAPSAREGVDRRHAVYGLEDGDARATALEHDVQWASNVAEALSAILERKDGE